MGLTKRDSFISCNIKSEIYKYVNMQIHKFIGVEKFYKENYSLACCSPMSFGSTLLRYFSNIVVSFLSTSLACLVNAKKNKKNTRTAMNTAGHIKGINENICLS